jgi:ribosomal protein S18 acetylase RimI-like enzyme
VTQEVVIKTATLGDSAVVAELLTELNRTVGIVGADREHEKLPENTDLTPRQVEARLRGVAGIETVLVAYADGEPAGFTSVRVIPYLDQDTPYAEVTQLYVRPQFQRRGIASRLVEAAEKLAQDAEATCLHILTGVDNTDGQAFYRAAGYVAECYDFQKFLERRPVNA